MIVLCLAMVGMQTLENPGQGHSACACCEVDREALGWPGQGPWGRRAHASERPLHLASPLGKHQVSQSGGAIRPRVSEDSVWILPKA